MNSDKKDKIIAELSLRIVYLSLLILSLIVLFLVFYSFKPTKEVEIKPLPLLCGNAVMEGIQRDNYIQVYGDNVNFDKGDILFKQNCAVCHTMSNVRITGPGLANVSSRVPNDKWLYNYILKSDSMFIAQDPYTLKLHKEYPETRMHKFDSLTQQNVNDIIAFIKTNSTTMVILP